MQLRWNLRLHLCLYALGLILAMCAHAQPVPAGAKPQPDVLILTDGEKLIGHLERSIGGKLTFKSDLVGEITIEWSKVKELQSSQQFAVIGKDVKLGRRHKDAAQIPQGTVAMSNQTLTVTPQPAGTPQQIPVAATSQLIDEPTFQQSVLSSPSFLQAWHGAVTAGATLVEATQQSRTFNGSVHLVRAIPAETWLDARDRTILDFSGASGLVSQPNTPRLKTELYHAGLERDQYFSPRVYAFGQAMFDHNFSQGLDLQQDYGGGVGWTAISNPRNTLDLKGSVNYVRQQFQNSVPTSGTSTVTPNEDLLGSTFTESFTRKFAREIVFLQQISATPAWNNLNAYAATASATVSVPVYKRIGFSVGASDSFLNNPPSGFKKNSFQFTTGITYTR